jgi:hypothetical protein
LSAPTAVLTIVVGVVATHAGWGAVDVPSVWEGTSGTCPPSRLVILFDVEAFFTALLVLVGLAVVWFTGYVVYRLYSDQR